METNTAIRLEDMTDKEDTSELTKGLLTDFQKSTSLHILNDIVFLVHRALAQLSAASTSRFIALTTLVDALYARFNHSYDLSDLNEAISSLQDNSKCCVERDQQELNINFRICGLLATRFDSIGDIADLQTALDWTTKGTETSVGILESLEFANKLWKQFKMSGDMAKLNTAVALFRNGIAQLPQGSENHATVINNFASALWSQFKQTHEQSDLDEAISLYIQLRHANQSSTLSNFANKLQTQFEQVGQQSDLDEAISLHRQALEL